jgi:hypothetical protein
MNVNISLPEHFKIVQATAGAVTTNGGITCDYVSLKNVHKAWIVAHFDQAAAHATGIDPKQATAVAGTSVKVFANTLPIWANEDAAASDTLVAQTAAVTYNLTADIKTKMVIFEIDPAQMDVANGFGVLGCTVDNSGEATNFVSIVYYLQERYAQATPPAAITD